MPKSKSKLSNCYIPLPLISPEDEDRRKRDIAKNRDSGDGKNTLRSPHALRHLVLETSVMESATGSAMIELGYTKVLCQVIGPITAASSDLIPSSVQPNMDEGILHCEVKYASSFSYPSTMVLASSVSSVDQLQQQQAMSSGRLNSWIINRESNLSNKLSAALAAAVPLQQYAKCILLVKCLVLQDDGAILPACITAASLALVDAAVEVYDVVTACSVAIVDHPQQLVLLADPSLEEEQAAQAIMTLALLPNWKEVTVWEQTGRLTPDVANTAMELCRDGCRTMHRFMREHWISQASKSSSNDSSSLQ